MLNLTRNLTQSKQNHFAALCLGLIILLNCHVTIATAATSDFSGVIGLTESDSTPAWPAQATPSSDAPNILIWLMDDVGFGHTEPYGGLVNTPTLNKLAQNGVRFNNFHTTPLCSPTRASLLTGRNPHSVGMGAHANTASGYPGYNARVPRSAASIGKILKNAGYATYALGKWDQLPSEDTSVAGPFDYWPSGQGFDHFYGFLHFDANHFEPTLWQDHTPVTLPVKRDPDYHLTKDLADRAIKQIQQLRATQPTKPFLMYWSTGAVHAPHHAPKAYINKYKGKFDAGWEQARQQILQQQKNLGIVPANVQLPEWSNDLPSWSSLNKNQQRMAARQMEAFAGMLDHADEQFGRIIDTLEALNILDNTIVVVLSDNGASAEGGLAGSVNELVMGQLNWEDNLEYFDTWGSDKSYPHYSASWASAGNTPFKYFKQSAFEGGHRAPLLIHWPKKIKEANGIRSQFHHVSDIVPSLLDMANIDAPISVDGVTQQPMDGSSFKYAIDNSDAAQQKQVQYYELWGNRGVWANGWKASIQARSKPWNPYQRPDLNAAPWELYNLNNDFNERVNLAQKRPEKLLELQNIFHQEAQKYQVYPLLPDSFKAQSELAMQRLEARDFLFSYDQTTNRVPFNLAPPIHLLPYELTAHLNNSGNAKNQVIFSFGGHDGGFSLYTKDGRPVLAYNRMGLGTQYIKSGKTLPKGESVLSISMQRDKQTGHASISINGEVVGTGTFDNILNVLPLHETFDVGVDLGSSVVEDYLPRNMVQSGFIQKFQIKIVPPSPAVQVSATGE